MPYLESLTSEHLFGILRDYFRPECSVIGDESVDTLSFEKADIFSVFYTINNSLFQSDTRVIHERLPLEWYDIE